MAHGCGNLSGGDARDTRKGLRYGPLMTKIPESVDETRTALAKGGYLADEALSTSVFLAL